MILKEKENESITQNDKMNTKEFRKVILQRKQCDNEWDYGIEQCCKKELEILAEDIPSTIEFLRTECTADEYSWISEIIDDLADCTRSQELIECYKSLMSKFPEECERYRIASSVQSGESILINGAKHMTIGAYQFAVTGNIDDNFNHIKRGIRKATGAGVRLLVFPECAVTGYPPRDIPSSSAVDFTKVDQIHESLQELAVDRHMFLVVGTILQENGRLFNAVLCFRPDGKKDIYRKRALYGWDRDNFTEGEDSGIVQIDSFRIGIRICYEVRFPEYFREFYRQQTDLNLILFYDVADHEDPDRYTMIKGHIQTRAVENVCPVLACNSCSQFQTAPTILFDRSGKILAEMQKGKEGLLCFDWEQNDLSFGEQGRKELSDSLTRQ